MDYDKDTPFGLRGDDDDKPKEECAIFGVFDPNGEVQASRLTFFGLYTLQHRGQEGCGLASNDGTNVFHVHKGMGLVTQVFKEKTMKQLKGSSCIGHNRYSTVGSSQLTNAQPFVIETLHGPLAIAHNGQLTSTHNLRRRLLENGVGMFTSSDTEVLVQMLAKRPPGEDAQTPDWEGRIKSLMEYTSAAYSLVIMTKDSLIGVRDPFGFRPLCIGQIPPTSPDKKPVYILSSESCAMHTVGADFMRDVAPGEIIRIDKFGIHSSIGSVLPPEKKTALCVFEYVYFSRPDSLLDGGRQLVHSVRQNLGRQLAREHPAPDADIVIGVPDSSTPAAIGYALESGLPFTEGLTKNRYIGRTFIAPDQAQRQRTIGLKFNPLVHNLRGKSVVIIDDSIVRGNTLSHLISMIREAGPKAIHVRISSPPVQHPCFMGVDMSTYEELIGHNHTVEQIRQHIGADSLGYLSIDGMMEVVREGIVDQDKDGHCNACFSGDYPLEIEDLVPIKAAREERQREHELREDKANPDKEAKAAC
jgi:amidophosphoribosyltransferase